MTWIIEIDLWSKGSDGAVSPEAVECFICKTPVILYPRSAGVTCFFAVVISS